jgi:EpsI family protein
MPKFLSSTPMRVLSLFLILQAAVLYGFNRNELRPEGRPLAEFPTSLNGWALFQEGVIEEDVQRILRADDLLNRTYASPIAAGPTNLFIAAFRSQRNGQAPHSPKNCLPGNGWVPSVSDVIQIDVPGRPQPLEVNRYVVQKGDAASLVLYWYQSRDRAVASEYKAKFYVVADAIRYNRTDTALVRVVVPVVNRDSKAALETAKQFVRDSYGTVRAFLPS